MGVYRRFAGDSLPSFVTTNTNERRAIFSSADACRLLLQLVYEVGIKLLAFAIMPDHVHLIVSAASADELSRAMQLLQGRFARRYNELSGRTGAVWQSRYHEHALRSEAALLRAIEYVHHNPVVAGLASDPEAYAWSSANRLCTTDLAEYLGQAEA